MIITVTLNTPTASNFAEECLEWIIHSSNIHYGFSPDMHSVRFEGLTEEEFHNVRSYAMYLGAPVIGLR